MIQRNKKQLQHHPFVHNSIWNIFESYYVIVRNNLSIINLFSSKTESICMENIIAWLSIKCHGHLDINSSFWLKMRLPKHKLPKGVNKQERSMKHKDSRQKQLRKAAKAAKVNEMQVEQIQGEQLKLIHIIFVRWISLREKRRWWKISFWGRATTIEVRDKIRTKKSKFSEEFVQKENFAYIW